MSRRRHSGARTKSERALEEIYAEIPNIPDCNGGCVESCGPIAMFEGEFARVKRSLGRTPRMSSHQLTCPMLSPTGKCMVYSVRPYICRLWGTTKTLACPRGCEPERWLTTEEAKGIFERIMAIAGPRVDGPMGPGMEPISHIKDLWEGIALEQREGRMALIEHIRATQQ